MTEGTHYERKDVRALRGTEAMTIAKWQKDGWELLDQEQGRLRTTLTFRRPKPRISRLMIGALGGAALIIAAVVVIGVVRESGSSSDGSATEAGSTASEPASETPTRAAQPAEASEHDSAASEEALTIANSPELAAILRDTDYCSAAIADFATKHRDRTIEFDGSIGAMSNHGSYKTRYDILITAGEFSTESAPGPAFQFRDVNTVSDLHLTGPSDKDTIGVGDGLHIVAKVQGFESRSCLFLLDPVSTRFR